MHGLYLITNDDDFLVLEQKIRLALASGVVALLQYRRKNVVLTQQSDEIEQLKTICQKYNIPLIINDNLQLAIRYGCGVHLGQQDGSLVEAREQLGEQAIIGRTCHASLALAQQAVDEGASYLAFGAVYVSSTKPNASRVELQTLQQARQQFDLPMCAIGGLTVENSKPVLEAGVDLVAVVGDVLGLPRDQLDARLQMWKELFKAY